MQDAIQNSVAHVFGNHSHCKTVCQRTYRNEENELLKLYVKSYIACIARLVGDQRFNFTSGGSFTQRWIGAGLRHSGGPLGTWVHGRVYSK